MIYISHCSARLIFLPYTSMPWHYSKSKTIYGCSKISWCCWYYILSYFQNSIELTLAFTNTFNKSPSGLMQTATQIKLQRFKSTPKCTKSNQRHNVPFSCCEGLAYVGGCCYDKANCAVAELGVTTDTGKPYPASGLLASYVGAHEIAHKYVHQRRESN